MTNPPPPANIAALAIAVQRARNNASLTLDELAERSEVSRRTLIEIEQGRVNPSVRILHAIAHATHSAVGDLMTSLCEGHLPPG